MSDDIRGVADRLREIGERLASTDLPDEEAEALAREAADLAARGGVLLDQRLRELADEGSPEPDG